MVTEYVTSPEGDAALSKVTGQGFALPESPGSENQPSLPADLEDLDDKGLMEEFSLFTAWADYASAQVGLAVIAERAAELDLEWHLGLHYADAPSKQSVTGIKATAIQDPLIYEAKKKVDACYAYRRLVQDMAERYERDAAVLSRELTRRTSEGSVKAARRDRWKS